MIREYMFLFGAPGAAKVPHHDGAISGCRCQCVLLDATPRNVDRREV